MKQRRLFPASPDMPPTPPLGQSLPKPCLARPHSVTPSSTTPCDIGNTQSQTDLAHPRAAVNNEHYYTPSSSRSPSDTESASAADYQEWPFQGFLKRVTIGSQITYNLEFSLSDMPKHLSLSLHSEVLSTSSRESSVEAVVSRRAVTSRKPGKELTKNQESRLAKMVHDDKTWAEIGGHFPGHTLQSLKDNFFTKQGGEASKAGPKAWCEGRWSMNKDSRLLETCGCVGCENVLLYRIVLSVGWNVFAGVSFPFFSTYTYLEPHTVAGSHCKGFFSANAM
jgi:hypothetical protein